MEWKSIKEFTPIAFFPYLLLKGNFVFLGQYHPPRWIDDEGEYVDEEVTHFMIIEPPKL